MLSTSWQIQRLCTYTEHKIREEWCTTGYGRDYVYSCNLFALQCRVSKQRAYSFDAYIENIYDSTPSTHLHTHVPNIFI